MENFVRFTTLGLGFVSIILVPTFVLIVRGMVKWTKVEGKLDEVVKDMKELVENKDRIHAAMLEQMKDDRSVTDRRLRWLEENLWKKGRNNAV